MSAWQKSNLAPYVFRNTSAEYRKPLLPHYAQAIYRWKAQETEFRALLKAWNDAGIVPLLIKGAAMALKYYAQPAERYFGDIDLVLDRSQMSRARELAQDLGWQVIFDDQRDPVFSIHEALGLLSPGRNIKLDVHHSLLKHPAAFAERARGIYRQLENSMETFDWEGLKVQMLAPVDAAIVPLILHRAWYRDRWNLKRFDYLDLDLLRRAGLTRESLLERATELNCKTTVELFLHRCDPWEQVLDVTPLGAAQMAEWKTAVAGERGYTEKQATSAYKNLQFKNSGFLASSVLQGLGWVLRAALVLQKQQSLQALCSRVPLRNVPPDLGTLHRVRFGVVGASRVLSRFPRGGSGMCVLRAVSALWWLRSAGIDAELVSGIRNIGGEIKGHAWIEYRGTVVAMIADDPIASMLYKINFRSSGTKNPPQNPGAASGQGPTAAG